MARRSSLELLPPPVLAKVHGAIVEGATIDEIVRRIRANGGTSSRSAVVRYVKGERERLRAWREEQARDALWLAALGVQPEDGTGPGALKAVRALAMRVAGALGREEKPPPVEQIATLALALQRIASAGKSGADRESAAGRSAGTLAGWPRSAEEQKKGLSPDAVAHIRAAVEGHWGIHDPVAGEEAVAEAYHQLKARDAEGE